MCYSTRNDFDTMENKEEKSLICQWIGDGEGCRYQTIHGRSYCEVHHDRMYVVMPPEMADYIIEKELRADLHNIS